MKRHAAFPHGGHLCGVLEVIGQVIKQHVPETATGKDADGRVDDEVIELLFRDRDAASGRTGLNDEVSRGEPEQVHQAVPAELQRTDSEKNRIDVGIRYHRGR